MVTRSDCGERESPELRAELDGIPTYKPGRPAAAGGPVAFKLSSNENPYPPLPGVLEAVTSRPRRPSTATRTWPARG